MWVLLSLHLGMCMKDSSKTIVKIMLVYDMGIEWILYDNFHRNVALHTMKKCRFDRIEHGKKA